MGIMSNAVWLFWQSFFSSGRNFLENSGYGWDPPPTFSCLCPQQLVCWRKIHHWGRLVLPSNCVSNNTGIPNSACLWIRTRLPFLKPLYSLSEICADVLIFQEQGTLLPSIRNLSWQIYKSAMFMRWTVPLWGTATLRNAYTAVHSGPDD